MAKTIITNTSETAYPRYQHDDGKYYSYPQPAGAPNWNTLLARTGTGTPDPTFDPKTDITYVGSFRIPFSNANGGTNRGKQALVFKPATAGNPNGSVFLGGLGGWSEWQIPTLSTSLTYTALPAAPLLQGWFDPITECAIQPPAGSDRTGMSGWGKYIDGKLFMGYHSPYSSATNTTNLIICDNPEDFSGANYQGMINLSGGDHLARYSCEIPPEWRSSFGGDTHINGICLQISINARSSFGHSVYSWNAASVGPSDTSVASTQHVHFPLDAPHPWYDGDNSDVTSHYESVLGTDMRSYVNLPPASRLTDLSGLPLPAAEIRRHFLTNCTYCGCAFIPPGTDTLVFVGQNRGGRYGIGYKDPTIEFGTAGFVSGGYDPWSYYDRDNCFWTYNLNDVVGAANAQDIDYIEYGHFMQEPWSTAISKDRGLVMSGDFDPATGRLYLLQENIPYSNYEGQHIVSVYQVGGGE